MPRWAYRTFGCIPASPGADFSDLDILVAAGLNAQPDVNAIGALQLATRKAAPYLATAAARGPAFTELPPTELGNDPSGGSTGWLLTQAYEQMLATRHVGRARAHKVLHHKQPHLVPLLDNVTAGIYQAAREPGSRGGLNLWQYVRAENNDSRAEFEDLRDWFARQAARRGGAPLGLPRLHDILLWLKAKGPQWDEAVTLGTALS